jgi:hypothetical protein
VTQTENASTIKPRPLVAELLKSTVLSIAFSPDDFHRPVSVTRGSRAQKSAIALT